MLAGVFRTEEFQLIETSYKSGSTFFQFKRQVQGHLPDNCLIGGSPGLVDKRGDC